MKTPSRFVFRVEGVMSYRVELRETGRIIGFVQRTRDGWDARLAGWGNRDGDLVVESYPGSRETAAGALLAAFSDTYSDVPETYRSAFDNNHEEI